MHTVIFCRNCKSTNIAIIKNEFRCLGCHCILEFYQVGFVTFENKIPNKVTLESKKDVDKSSDAE
jgi:hypothetical protein